MASVPLPTSTLQILVDSTSIRGIQKVRNAPATFTRVLWVAFIISMAIILCGGSGILISGYFNYSTAWYESTQFDSLTEFPAITLCSHNPFSLRANKLWKEKQILTPQEFKANLFNETKELMRDGYVASRQMALFDDVEHYYTALKHHETVALGHDRDMLYFCVITLKGGDLAMSDNCNLEKYGLRVIRFSHSQFFNCWTVEGMTENSTRSIIGLTLMVKLIPLSEITGLHGAFTVDLLSRGEGLKVVVHERGTYPHVKSNAINVQPGQMNRIIYRPVQWHRYNSPISPCGNHLRKIIDLDRTFSYTFLQCLDSQVQKEFLSVCSCMLTEYPNRLIPSKDNVYCTSGKEAIKNLDKCYEKVLNVQREVRKKAQKSTCLPRCHEFTYAVEFTVNKLIASPKMLKKMIHMFHLVDNFSKLQNHTELDKSEYFNQLDEMNTSEKDDYPTISEKSFDEDGFTYVTLIRKNDDSTLMREKLMLDVNIIISRVGGFCSLCLGLTSTFFAEMIEFIYLSILAERQRRQKRSLTTHSEVKRSELSLSKSVNGNNLSTLSDKKPASLSQGENERSKTVSPKSDVSGLFPGRRHSTVTEQSVWNELSSASAEEKSMTPVMRISERISVISSL
jgi:hypothetical protein